MKKKIKSSDGMMEVSEPTEYKPRFSMPIKMIPVAKAWEVGEKYELALSVVQTGRRKDEYEDEVTFEILKAGEEDAE